MAAMWFFTLNTRPAGGHWGMKTDSISYFLLFYVYFSFIFQILDIYYVEEQYKKDGKYNN